MSRDSILIANSVSYGDSSKNIGRSVIKSVVDELADKLTNLEDQLAFKVTKVLDEGHVAAKELIRKAIKRSGTAENTLLLYYFGHAIKPPFDEELYLYFNDSDLDDPGSMLAFSQIVQWLKLYKPPKIVVILDCCFAGTVGDKLHLLRGVGGSYYLMASVNPKEKALVDYGGERAYGVFSKYILQAFRNPAARASARMVTLKSFYEYVVVKMKEVSKLEPYSMDGNLADEPFFTQTSKPVIHARLRNSPPKKSIYRKLFVIVSTLYRNGEQSERYLYAALKKRKQREFRQPYKKLDGTLEYDFVSDTAFHRYVKLAVMLGMIRQRDLLSLTPVGREMARDEGGTYNIRLYEMIVHQWAERGLDVSDFEDAIYQRMKNGGVPSSKGIYRDLDLSGEVELSKDLFYVLFDLTGYVGALNYTADKTFFPPVTEDA